MLVVDCWIDDVERMGMGEVGEWEEEEVCTKIKSYI